jgi:biotin carboxyl carrier protein
MLVATLEDLTGSVEVVVFPKVYEQTASAWADDSIVLVSGRLDRRDEAPQILCEAVWSWEDVTRMGVEAFGVERDRLLAPRGRWERERNGRASAQRAPIPVEATAPVAVAVAETVGAPEPAEEPPAPTDAVPLQSVPEGSAGTVAVLIGEEVPNDQLLSAIESVKGALATRPGPLPVELWISVAGASRQVRLPDRVAWDDRLAEALSRAAGVPVAVELRSAISVA